MIRYSAISAYYKCPRLYQLDYIEKLPKVGPESSALHFGSAVHLAIEDVLQGGPGVLTFQMLWESRRNQDMVYYGRESWESLMADGERLLSLFKRNHAKHIKAAYVEEQISGVYDKVKLMGTVDCAGEYKGVKSVIDFKTSGTRYPAEKLVVSEQLYVYNHLLSSERQYDAVQHVYIVLRKTGRDGEAGIQVITKPVSPAELTATLNNVRDVALEIAARKTFTMNRGHCIIANKYKCERYETCYGKQK